MSATGVGRSKFVATDGKIADRSSPAHEHNLVLKKAGRQSLRIQRLGEINRRERFLWAVVIDPALAGAFAWVPRGLGGQRLGRFPGSRGNFARPRKQLSHGVVGIDW